MRLSYKRCRPVTVLSLGGPKVELIAMLQIWIWANVNTGVAEAMPFLKEMSIYIGSYDLFRLDEVRDW